MAGAQAWTKASGHDLLGELARVREGLGVLDEEGPENPVPKRLLGVG
jgi:hypothetical protein